MTTATTITSTPPVLGEHTHPHRHDELTHDHEHDPDVHRGHRH